MGSRIPVIASAEDLGSAVQLAQRDQSIQWYVAKRAVALNAIDQLPDSWEPVVAAMGGDWSEKARKTAVKKGEAYGEGSFPIRDKADLKRAVQAFGRAKDKAKAKAHIIRRARALGAVSMLPDSWNIGTTASVEPEEIDLMRVELLRQQMGAMK